MADRVGGMFDPQAVKSLDEALVWAIHSGWPIWVTNGQGNDEPSKTEHDFSQHTLGEGARIDFHRGIAADDCGFWIRFAVVLTSEHGK